MAKMIAWTRRGHRGPLAAVRGHEHRDALRLRLGASCLAVAIDLLWCNCALAAEPRVLLLRGSFGVFSTGMDSLWKIKFRTAVSSCSPNPLLCAFPQGLGQ